MSSPDKPSKLSLSCCTTTPGTMPPKSTSSSPGSGVSNEFLEFEGTTTFEPSPSPTYRYSMTLTKGKLRVWLEDCESKKQWLASGLDQTDYVDSNSAIPNATASDYVEYFHELLDDGYNDKDDTPITFKRHNSDVFRLEVTVKIQVLKHARVATYAIPMEPISLDRVDVLESRVRDMQQEIINIRVETEKVAAIHCNVHAELKDTRNKEISQLKEQVKTLLETNAETVQLQSSAKLGDWICWGNPSNRNTRVTHPGTYQVTAIVNHKAISTAESIQLFKGPECIQTAYCGNTEGSCRSTYLACVTRVPKNYEFAVKCPVALAGTSYLTLIRIGK